LRTAECLGRRLAEIGFSQISGGKGGVMEAAARGAAQSHGLTIGILPDNHWSGANPHIRVPIATGLGSARNAIIARAAFALVAVGGELGTLSEIVLGLHFGRLVVTLCDSPFVEGAVIADDVEDAVARVCARFLAIDEIPSSRNAATPDDGER